MITSPKNPKVVQAVRLKKRAMRDRDGRFLVEGAQAVGEALTSGVALETLFHAERDRLDPIVARAVEAGVEVEPVSDPVMERLTSTVTPQGLVAVAPFVDTPLDELPSPLGSAALLYAVRDPGNAGTVLRSADAAGSDTVVFCGESVDLYNPKTVRASAGSLFHLPVVRSAPIEDAVEAMRSRGLAVYAASGRGEHDLWSLDLSAPAAFVFGNEAWGLPDEVAALADATVRVPHQGRAESLNLAAAATVCLFEAARQRAAGAGDGGDEADGPSLDTLIAGAAHDIRSPLTAVKGFASTLARRWRDMNDEQRQHMLTGIAHDADRLNQTVKLLVDAARLSAGRLELSPQLVDVGSVVADLSRFLAASGAYPEVVWAGSEVRAMLDPDRLWTMLASMCEAALWWAQEGPIQIETREADGRLTVEVRRTGTELTDEQAEDLFRARAPGSGSGSKIGLFVTRGLAHTAGGQASAAVEGGSLVLRLDLPAP